MRPLIKYINDFRLRLVDLLAYWKKLGLFYRNTHIVASEIIYRTLNRPITTGIQLEGVSYCYPGTEKRVISEVSLAIPVGKTTAIVGRTGSGKSTLVDLITGLSPPRCGKVLIDGTDLNLIKKSDWRNALGVVDQETVLINSTIVDNIRFGNIEVDNQSITRAVEISGANEFIEKLENGLETRIGSRGFKLSGGQKQRIALARAIARNPDVLILDEATSSLDNISEKLIQQALDELKGVQTMLIIAHRLSTIRDADNIVVIDKGRIVGQGDWNTLVQENQIFGDMVKKMG